MPWHTEVRLETRFPPQMQLTKANMAWRLCDWHALGLLTMGMKTNNMSEIENSLLVNTRLLDPLKMLQHLVVKASTGLAKAHLSCALMRH
jgi:hypothetical protein